MGGQCTTFLTKKLPNSSKWQVTIGTLPLVTRHSLKNRGTLEIMALLGGETGLML
jgi:hypothetical protein